MPLSLLQQALINLHDQPEDGKQDFVDSTPDISLVYQYEIIGGVAIKILDFRKVFSESYFDATDEDKDKIEQGFFQFLTQLHLDEEHGLLGLDVDAENPEFLADAEKYLVDCFKALGLNQRVKLGMCKLHYISGKSEFFNSLGGMLGAHKASLKQISFDTLRDHDSNYLDGLEEIFFSLPTTASLKFRSVFFSEAMDSLLNILRMVPERIVIFVECGFPNDTALESLAGEFPNMYVQDCNFIDNKLAHELQLTGVQLREMLQAFCRFSELLAPLVRDPAMSDPVTQAHAAQIFAGGAVSALLATCQRWANGGLSSLDQAWRCVDPVVRLPFENDPLGAWVTSIQRDLLFNGDEPSISPAAALAVASPVSMHSSAPLSDLAAAAALVERLENDSGSDDGDERPAKLARTV